MTELAELLERLRRGPELVAAVTTGAAGTELDFSAGDGKWTVRQIVCHLADAEMAAGVRLRRMIAEDRPRLEAYDQDAWATNLDYAKRKFSQALEAFRRVRAENYELLKDLPETAFARSAVHSERGEMTLLDLLRAVAEHAENHSNQLRAARDAYRQHRTKAN